MSESLADLFDMVTVMHSTDDWTDAHHDLVELLGAATFSDGNSWATFPGLSLSDEGGPRWSLLARTADLDEVARRATKLSWTVGIPTPGGHELRLSLVSPAGLAVVAYVPTSKGM